MLALLLWNIVTENEAELESEWMGENVIPKKLIYVRQILRYP